MKQRILSISDFRNLGVSRLDDEDYNLSKKPEYLILNSNYEGDKMGGLVIVIGENNTGKSNLADALERFSYSGDLSFDQDDAPNYMDYYEGQPSLKLDIKSYPGISSAVSNGVVASPISQTVVRIYQEDDRAVHAFCNDAEAIRAAIKLLSIKIRKNPQHKSVIDNISELIDVSHREVEAEKLKDIYSRLKGLDQRIRSEGKYLAQSGQYQKHRSEYDKELEDIEAEYQRELNIVSQQLLEHARIAIEEFESRGEGDLLESLSNEESMKWKTIKSRATSSRDYTELRAAYSNLNGFITRIIKSYNSREQEKVPDIKFITPREVVKRTPNRALPVQPKPSPLSNPVYNSAREILDEVFTECDVKYGNLDTLGLKLPSIIKYSQPKSFTNDDLSIRPEDLSTSPFFISLFSFLGRKVNSISNVYEKAKRVSSILSKEQAALNARLDKTITDKFNRLYGKDATEAYRFELVLSKDDISLTIFKGEDPVLLSQQSTGFKWFFNLYFGLLSDKSLNDGDVVIMDEPASGLSPFARKECSKMLRKHGEENGVTFVIVTHDMFWVDSDYLDDLRIVKKRQENKGSCIQNDFSRIESTDTDTFLSIKRAFGVDTHVFYPPGVRLVFVEGITDYNYLSTFKILRERETKEKLDITFLPIGGLGARGEQEMVLENLMKQCKDPILLVDSDVAGKELKSIKEQKGYDGLHIVELDSIDYSFKEIESLFDPRDLEKYGLSKEKDKKLSVVSKAFKKRILWNREEEAASLKHTTKSNFYRVLDYLLRDV